MNVSEIVIPAKAGTHGSAPETGAKGIPAFAGMTVLGMTRGGLPA
jgi:hypothetical protein